MDRKDFNTGYDKREFYSIMGEFFAEEKYKKEMPYMKNSESQEWSLFFKDGVLAGFYSHENKKGCIYISSVYVVEDFRKNGVLSKMITDMISRFENMRMTSNNEILLNALLKNGFKEISARGSYKVMERGAEDEKSRD